MKSTVVSILDVQNDGQVALIKFIDGKKYKLQHPGNRVYLDWQKDAFSMTEGVDQAKFLDKAFEYCVIPEGHTFRPSIDNVKAKDLGVWSKLLRRFCDGDIDLPVGRHTEAPDTETDKG